MCRVTTTRPPNAAAIAAHAVPSSVPIASIERFEGKDSIAVRTVFLIAATGQELFVSKITVPRVARNAHHGDGSVFPVLQTYGGLDGSRGAEAHCESAMRADHAGLRNETLDILSRGHELSASLRNISHLPDSVVQVAQTVTNAIKPSRRGIALRAFDRSHLDLLRVWLTWAARRVTTVVAAFNTTTNRRSHR
jgi:hypothetical protein